MPPRHDRGYALIAALITLAVASLAVTLAVGRAQVDAQRERETQLLFVGDQYRRALADYFLNPPLGQAASYPQSLEDLVEDRRGPVLRRWLRRLYADPVTGADWQLELAQGRIVGLHSSSASAPLRHGGFDLADTEFAKAKSYKDWHFTADQVLKLAAANAQPQVAPGESVTAPPGYEDPAKICYANFIAPAAYCRIKVPPPMGHDGESCLQAYQQLYNQCMASIPGGGSQDQ